MRVDELAHDRQAEAEATPPGRGPNGVAADTGAGQDLAEDDAEAADNPAADGLDAVAAAGLDEAAWVAGRGRDASDPL